MSWRFSCRSGEWRRRGRSEGGRREEGEEKKELGERRMEEGGREVEGGKEG